jgi:hypothetical protein
MKKIPTEKIAATRTLTRRLRKGVIMGVFLKTAVALDRLSLMPWIDLREFKIGTR